MAFPASLDDLSTTRASAGTDRLSSPDHLVHHTAEDALIEAIQAKVGVDASAVVTSLDYILKNANSINPGHKHNFLSALDGVPAQAVYVDAAGNVGIGTTDPSDKLHVVVTIRAVQDGDTFWAKLQNDNNYASYRIYDTSDNILLEAGGYGPSHATKANQAYISAVQNADLTFATNNQERVRITNNGNVGIGATVPTAKVDINSDILRLRTAKTPASAGAAGNAGDICWDASNIYVCVATNTWKRVAIAAW